MHDEPNEIVSIKSPYGESPVYIESTELLLELRLRQFHVHDVVGEGVIERTRQHGEGNRTEVAEGDHRKGLLLCGLAAMLENLKQPKPQTARRADG
mgnify:CR=1 FL=1